MEIAFNQRLYVKQAIVTLVASIAIGFLIGFTVACIQYWDAEQEIAQEAEFLATALEQPARRTLLDGDQAQAQKLVTGLLNHPYVREARLLDESGKSVAKATRERASSAASWFIFLLFGEERIEGWDIIHGGERLGRLEIGLDLIHLGNHFLLETLPLPLLTLLGSVMLAALLLYFTYHMITKPLNVVTNSISEFDPSKPGNTQIDPPAGHENDEIGVLVESTARLLTEIEGLFGKRKRDEERLTVYLEELENIVENRTAALTNSNEQLMRTNEQYREAKEEAQKIAQARSEFLTNMSHEIRTPLNGVLGMIGLTIDTPLTDEQRHNLEIAHNSGISLLDILNDILDLSKFESGKYTLENIDFDLRQTVEEVTGLLSQNAHSKHFEMTAAVDPEFPELVRGDPTRIRQIISNLTGNAVKFTSEGEVSVRVKCMGQADRAIKVRIDVEDTGIGVPKHAIEKIFQPFSQATSSTTREFGGTGIGLSLCRQLTEAMGGDISIASEEGRGSVFSVSIPMQIAENPAEEKVPEELKRANVIMVTKKVLKKHLWMTQQVKFWGAETALIDTGLDDGAEQIAAALKSELTNLVIVDDPDLSELVDTGKNSVKLALMGSPGQLSQFDAGKVAAIKTRINVPIRRNALQKTLLTLLGVNASTKVAETAKAATSNASECKILLVEDNNVNQIVATGMLKKIGYQVFIANNGKEAVRAVEHGEYNLALMDCQMPVMDGFEATREIRKLEKGSTLPIVALTANALKEDRERCEQAGMDDYLTKPYKQDALQAVIEKWLISGRSPDASADVS